MPKAKEISLDLRKRIVDAHNAGEGYTKLSKHFQVSRTGVRSIIKKFKESCLQYRTRLAEVGSQRFQRLWKEISLRVEGIMKKEEYEKILKENLKQSEAKLGVGRRFVFQHDDDPKHTSLLVKNYLQKAKVNVIDWPA